MLRTRYALVAGLAAALAIGVVTQSHAAPVRNTHVTVKAAEANGTYLFTPKKKTVHAGTTVVWKNTTDAPHTVTAASHNWKINKQLPLSKSASFTFKKAGTYKFYCTFHPYMKATIVVK